MPSKIAIAQRIGQSGLVLGRSTEPLNPVYVFRIGPSTSDTPLAPALVGSKAAGLVRLHQLGLRVPPALVLNAAASRGWRDRGALSHQVLAELVDGIRWLESETGLTLGGGQPLVVSVRSSPPASMPGMLGSVLNVGLTERTVADVIRRTGNFRLAWDSYRRFVRSFAETVRGVASSRFDELTATHVTKAGASQIEDLDALSLRDLALASADLLEVTGTKPPPQDAFMQLVEAIEAVMASWESPRARTYRRASGLDDRSGTGVLIQAMVFGNRGCRSGSGVAFTRNPATGRDELYVDFVFDAQGGDIVSGHAPTAGAAHLPQLMPGIWNELHGVKQVLERAFLDMQDIEFVVEEGRLHIIQTRSGPRTPWAALHIAVDLVRAGLIDSEEALQRLMPYQLDQIFRLAVGPGACHPLARAIGAGGGVAAGQLAFDSARAQQLALSGPVILARAEVSTDDFAGLSVVEGIVSRFGGRTSHAAVIARERNKACLVGCADLRVDDVARVCAIGPREFREGDLITLDGENGTIYPGNVPVVVERPSAALTAITSWQLARARMINSGAPSL